MVTTSAAVQAGPLAARDPAPDASHARVAEGGARPEPSAEMALANAAATGDVVATRELLAKLGPRVRRVVRAVLGPRQLGELDDVAQQAMLALVLALPQFRGECEPVHFASRIAARTAIAAARRARAAMGRRDDAADLDAVEADAAPPSRQATASRHASALRELLTRIPPEQAETIALRVVLGHSLEEVAEATGVPLNTVRSRMRLAKAALRAAIEADPAMAELEAWASE